MVNESMVNVLGVIRPTVEAVPALTQTGHVGILATPATVSSESYVLELDKLPSLQGGAGGRLTVVQQSCPMWVPLIEAGEHLHDGADYFVDLYLRQLLDRDPLIDTLVLGCTHYPLLLPKISQWLNKWYMVHGQMVNVLSQGPLVAASLQDYLHRHPEYRDPLSQGGTCTYLTTGNADRFAQSASNLGLSLSNLSPITITL